MPNFKSPQFIRLSYEDSSFKPRNHKHTYIQILLDTLDTYWLRFLYFTNLCLCLLVRLDCMEGSNKEYTLCVRIGSQNNLKLRWGCWTIGPYVYNYRSIYTVQFISYPPIWHYMAAILANLLNTILWSLFESKLLIDIVIPAQTVLK